MMENLMLCRSSICGVKSSHQDKGVTEQEDEGNNEYLLEKYENINNLTDLINKSERCVAEYMKYKFKNKKLYMWAGQALVALHPFCEIDYNLLIDSDTSIASVVSKTWFNLMNHIGKSSQFIVISGDSGSGKTFSACLCINYLSEKQNDKNSSDVLWKAWSHVPLLTTFGNASTIYNYNSSRFGKLLKMQYEDGEIKGAYIQTYMLEKSRVSGPNTGETNFHIFNQLLENTSEETLSKIHLSKNVNYRIAPKPANYQNYLYEEMTKSVRLLNITRTGEIFKVLSVILNLGNLQFINAHEKLSISNDSRSHLSACCQLLHCEPEELQRLFLRRLIAAKLRRATICYTSCVNTEECEERRNAFMRCLYERLFLWLVRQINQRISYEAAQTTGIGILDIYGFETFKFNTFEQLCINYANERLQHYFMNDYIARQMELLNEECESGFNNIDLGEYNKRINLLDGIPSIFGILNEECLVKRYNTDVFICARLSNSLKGYPHFIERGNNISTTFSIIHYAGPVEYDCKTMVTKNRDKIPEEMISFLKDCKFKFVKEILQDDDEATEGAQTQGKTLLVKFKKSLDKLMKTLNEGDVHYIKCLKPNHYQIAGYFDEAYIVSQLKYNGIMDILNLGLQNFPIKLDRSEFQKRFPRQKIEVIGEVSSKDIFIGKRMICLTNSSYKGLLALEAIAVTTAAVKVQNLFKRNYQKRNRAAKIIQRFFRSFILARHRLSSATLWQHSWSSDSSKKLHTSQKVIQTQKLRMTEQFVTRCREMGAPVSLTLEKLVAGVQSKPFLRSVFRGTHIMSRYKLPELPVRLHLRKTCLPLSTRIPTTELPGGLQDIL